MTCPVCLTIPTLFLETEPGDRIFQCGCASLSLFLLGGTDYLWQFVYRKDGPYHYMIRREGGMFVHLAPGLFVHDVREDEVPDIVRRAVTEAVATDVMEL